MAQFTGGGTAATETGTKTPTKTQSPPGTGGGKWQPGKRGRPPRGAKQAAQPEQQAEQFPEMDAENLNHFEEHAQSEFDLRRNPDTYPRRENGLPVPLYRVTRAEDDLHNYLAAMRPEDWGHCEMYVYRYYPRAKSIQGEPAYIDKIAQGPVDLTTIIETHGSGVYGFTLNDANVQGNRRTAMYAKVELRRDNIPEMWDLDTLDIDHKDNKQLVARLIRDGVLTNKGERIMQNDGATGAALAGVVDKLTNALLENSKAQSRAPQHVPDPNAAAMAAVNNKTIEMLGAANKAAIEAATAGNKSGGVAETLQLVQTILAATKPPDNSAMMTLLLETVKTGRDETRMAHEAAEKERQRAHEIQLEALKQKQTASDPFAQVETFMKIKNLFTGPGTGVERPLSWREQGIAMLGEHLPQILEVGGALVSNLGKPNPIQVGQLNSANQPAQLPPGGGVAQPMPPSINPQGQQAGQTQPQQGGQTQTQPQPTGPNGEPLTPEQQKQIERIGELQSQIQQQGRFLVDAITRGQDGYSFAESLVGMVGNLTYERARGYSLEEWLTAIFSFPQLQQQFKGIEHTVQTFVFEFLDYGNPESVDADDATNADEMDETNPFAPPAPTPPTPRMPGARSKSTNLTSKKKGTA
jgi:hypothetical protein